MSIAALKPDGRGDLRKWALLGAQELLDDWQRVRSILWALHDALKPEIETAKREAKGMMETVTPEAVMLNIDWLADRIDERASKLRQDIQEARGQS